MSCSRYSPISDKRLTIVHWTVGGICPYSFCLQFDLLHADLTLGAFIAALVIGMSLHYKKNVATEFYEYPQEWFASVSGTIG
jgi:hypothetical protein